MTNKEKLLELKSKIDFERREEGDFLVISGKYGDIVRQHRYFKKEEHELPEGQRQHFEEGVRNMLTISIQKAIIKGTK